MKSIKECSNVELINRKNEIFNIFQSKGITTKQRVLEFAKVMTKPESFLHFGDINLDKRPEAARMWMFENDMIMRLLEEAECEVCHTKGLYDIQNMDYLMNIALSKCINCGTFHKVTFTPKAETVNASQRTIAEVKVMANLSLREDIANFIVSYEGEEEILSNILSEEFEVSKKKYVAGEEVECPKCATKICWDESVNDEVNVPKLSYKERQDIADDLFAVVVATKTKISGQSRKIRMFPIHDKSYVRAALARLPQAAESLKKLGISQETVISKILKRAKEINMEELLKKYNVATVEELIQAMAKAAGASEGVAVEAASSIKTEIEKAMAESKELDVASKLTELLNPHVSEIVKAMEEKVKAEKAQEEAKIKEELATLKASLEEASKKLEAATVELKKYKDAEEEKVKAEIAAKIQSRKDELGEFAKEMKDEDLLDETKYEVAKLKKENADLKAGKVTPKPDLTKGSADKKVNETEQKARAKVNDIAFGRDGK